MAVIKPFKPLRPTSRFAGAVVAPPYDAVSVEEARQILQNDPLSFLKVLKPEVNVPFYSNSQKTVYSEAKNALREFINSGIFMQEEKPHFYIYTERVDKRRQSGVVGLFSCEEYGEGVIKRTEETKYMELEDRVQWIEYTNVQAGPVFLVYKERETVKEIINKIMEKPPEYDFITEDGVRHTVHSISEKGMLKEIQSVFLDIPALYIADGNHRALAACEVNKRRGLLPGFFLGAAVSQGEVYIAEYNRVVKDLNGLSPEEFLRRLKQCFYVEKIGSHTVKPLKKHTFGMYLDNEWYKLTVKENFIDGVNLLESLDVYLLEKYILQPILGINSERGNGRIDFVSGKENISVLEEKVDREGWAVSFSLFPVTVSEVIQVADSGFVMPPKSTWFEPKFRSGLFLNTLKDILAEFKNEKKLFLEEDYGIWF